MATKLKEVAPTVEDAHYEAWRPALIAFYRAQGPWFMSIQQLERGAPLTTDNKHDIDGLIAAAEVAPRLARAA